MKKIIFLFIVLLFSGALFAANADDISKDINSMIRGAENEFFKGKTDEAAAILKEVEKALGQLRSEDPDHQSLKTLQTKYDRLKEKIDRKLETGASSAAPASTSAPGAQKPSPPSQDLSTGAKGNLQQAGREMDFAEQEFVKGEKSLEEKKFNMVDSYIYNAGSRLDKAEGMLDKVIKNNKANPDHPDVASAFQRHKALKERLSQFTGKAKGKDEDVRQAASQAKEEDASLNSKWLPKITSFTETSSESRLQYLGSYNAQELAAQDKLYSLAKKALADVEKDVPAGQRPHELKNAVEKLRLALQVYEDQKKADNTNRSEPIENTLSDWEKRFEQNKKWNENSDQGLFVITKEKLEYQKKQIAQLSGVQPEMAKGFSNRLIKLEKENVSWSGKKRQWMERPRPFPKANMKSAALEKEMIQLLNDRGIKAEELVITDKDWWVQQGEFRYVTTAVMSKDKEGKYWSNISFRQIKTLTGYGPTEIWSIDETRIRLP